MKKLLLFILMIPAIGFSQVSTTQEEYNYLTKGIQEQYEKGLDIVKNGYKLEPIGQYPSSEGGYIFTLARLLDTNGVTKAISILQEPEDKKFSYKRFYCFPVNNNKLEMEFYNAIPSNVRNGLLTGLMKAIANGKKI